MIRIAHLITGLNTGGAERMLQKLVAAMDHTRFVTTVATLTRDIGSIGARIAGSGIPVRPLGSRLGKTSPLLLLNLLGWLRKEQPDILQTWLYHADLLGLLGGKVGGVKKIVWSIRCSDCVDDSAKRTTRLVVRTCAALSGLPDAVVVNSKAGQAAHTRVGYKPKRWELITNGFGLQVFHSSESAYHSVRAEFGFSPKDRLVGLVARADPVKDHLTFIRAASAVLQRHRDVRFVCVGAGVSESFRQHIPPDYVNAFTFTGERADLPRLNAAFDVACSASYSEGFSNSIGEAMACAVPCVVTDVGDSARIVGDTGVVVPPRSPAELAAGIIKLLEMPAEQREQLGAAARWRIQERFSIDAVAKQYEQLYESLLS